MPNNTGKRSANSDTTKHEKVKSRMQVDGSAAASSASVPNDPASSVDNPGYTKRQKTASHDSGDAISDPPVPNKREITFSGINYKNNFFKEGMKFSPNIVSYNLDSNKIEVYLPQYANYKSEEKQLLQEGIAKGKEIIKTAQEKGKEWFIVKKGEQPDFNFIRRTITDPLFSDEWFSLLYWQPFLSSYLAKKEEERIKQQKEASKQQGAHCAQQLLTKQQQARSDETFADFMAGFWGIIDNADPQQRAALIREEEKQQRSEDVDMGLVSAIPAAAANIEPSNRITRRDILNQTLTVKVLSAIEGEDVNALLTKLKEGWSNYYRKFSAIPDITADSLTFEIIHGKKAIRLIVKKYEHFFATQIKSFLETFDTQQEPYAKWFDYGVNLAKSTDTLLPLDEIFREVKVEKARLENLKRTFSNGFKCMKKFIAQAKEEEVRKQQELTKAEEARRQQELAIAEETRKQKVKAATEAGKILGMNLILSHRIMPYKFDINPEFKECQNDFIAAAQEGFTIKQEEMDTEIKNEASAMCERLINENNLPNDILKAQEQERLNLRFGVWFEVYWQKVQEIRNARINDYYNKLTTAFRGEDKETIALLSQDQRCHLLAHFPLHYAVEIFPYLLINKCHSLIEIIFKNSEFIQNLYAIPNPTNLWSLLKLALKASSVLAADYLLRNRALMRGITGADDGKPTEAMPPPTLKDKVELMETFKTAIESKSEKAVLVFIRNSHLRSHFFALPISELQELQRLAATHNSAIAIRFLSVFSQRGQTQQCSAGGSSAAAAYANFGLLGFSPAAQPPLSYPGVAPAVPMHQLTQAHIPATPQLHAPHTPHTATTLLLSASTLLPHSPQIPPLPASLISTNGGQEIPTYPFSGELPPAEAISPASPK